MDFAVLHKNCYNIIDKKALHRFIKTHGSESRGQVK